MILKNFNYQYSKTSRWIYPLFVKYNKDLSYYFKKLSILGCALGDNKHGIKVEDDRLLVIISPNGKYDYKSHKFEEPHTLDRTNETVNIILNLNKEITYYNYYNDSLLVGVFSIPLKLIAPACLDAVFRSKYSELQDMLGLSIHTTYDYHCISIIKKEPSAESSFRALVSAKLGIDADELILDEYEFEFIKEKEVLFNIDEIPDINLRNILNYNTDKIKNDIKLLIENKYDLEDKIMLYNIQLMPEVAEHLLKFLETGKDIKTLVV